MIILGIDPGTATTGYGVIDFKARKRGKEELKQIDYSCIETDKNLDFPKRLIILSKEIRKLTNYHKPKFVAMESLFFFQNKKTVMRVSQAIGVINLTLERMKIPVVEYTPLQVKKYLTQDGWAKKDAVQEEVRNILKIKEKIRPDDTADALAIAICAARCYRQKD